jgi:hypothetical protein
MTLHRTIDVAKKFLLGIGAGITVIIVIVLIVQLGIIIKNILFPPPIQPPNHAFDTLPAIDFPQNITSDKLTYTLNTITGTLPEFPDRLNVFQIQQPQPNFLNLNKAKEKAAKLGFLNDKGGASPETNLGDATYQWTKEGSVSKRLTINIITFDLAFTSNYLTSPTVLEAKNLGNSKSAVDATKDFLNNIGLNFPDIVYEKTLNAETNKPYVTKPQLFSIENGTLVPTTSLSKTQVIRVDLYQKNMTYALNTGVSEVTGGFKKLDIDLPILYPRPPYSTMHFWLASEALGPEVYAANFIHKNIIQDEKAEQATYPIKTSQEAYDELVNGKAYIASYFGFEKEIKIQNVFLAYFLGEDPQEYLMPIIVLEGDNGFFAYVSAVKDEWIKKNN